MDRRKGQVSLAWLGAGLFGACGLLGTGQVQDPSGDLPAATSFAGTVTLDLTQAPGMGCSVVRELHFEMLPADAEPRVPPSRHAPVCLAVYIPR